MRGDMVGRRDSCVTAGGEPDAIVAEHALFVSICATLSTHLTEALSEPATHRRDA